MSEQDLQKLLGGFAPDTLTPEERQKLFEAALHDQQLFNALADEQALKELLADPAVRRRLLQALAERRAGWRAWLDRFTRPAGLAWAGGVAAGIFAVVLGFRLYEDSLRQSSESAVLEHKPARRVEPPVTDKVSSPDTRREQVAASPQQPASGIERDKQRKRLQQEQLTDNKAPVAAPGTTAGQTASSTDQLTAAAPSPLSEPDAQSPLKAKKEGATTVSARNLFYARASGPDYAARADQRESRQTDDEPALAKKAPQSATPAGALALRYRFLSEQQELRGFESTDRSQNVTLIVESNQDAYLQIWKRTGDTLPELVLPAKETGHISLKTAAAEPQRLRVPRESDQLILRLSRRPFGPITRQEAVMAGRGSPGQLVESWQEEQATYVANPEPSTMELAVEIPIQPTQ